MTTIAPTRPVLRYHGGKWVLAPWIIAHFPPHRCYVEPFGGAASVLLRRPRAHQEVYNDLDGDVVNVFRVLRDPEAAEALRRACELTTFSRAEWEMASEPAIVDPVERARRTIVRSFFGHGSASVNPDHVTGFRGRSIRNGTVACVDWARWPQQVPRYVERLRGVVIERRDALELIRQHDDPGTLFYCDPPYPHATRGRIRQCYRHEMDDPGHRALAEVLHQVAGMVVVSGYACDLYDRDLYAGWPRVTCAATADGGRARTEALWLSPRTAAALTQQQAIPFVPTTTRSQEEHDAPAH